MAPFLQVEPAAPTAAGPTAPPRGGWVLAMGALAAPLFLLPLGRSMGWFLASLFHEAGHCAVAWIFGMPAVPAIRLDGHAAAVHRDQVHALVVVVTLTAVAFLVTRVRTPRARLWGALALIAYALLAWTPMHEVPHLLAGHAAELAFAGLALSRAVTGRRTFGTAEQVTYAACGFYLLGKNLWLFGGLAFSEHARAAYANAGSFGLTQDLTRAAQALGWSLPAVAACMLILALAVPLLLAVVLMHRPSRGKLR